MATKPENLGPKRWQKTVLAIAEVAWEDGGRGAVFNASEERSAVKRLAEYGYMKIGHSHRDELTASITVKGHLLLSALRMESVADRAKPARSASGQRRAAQTAAHIGRAQTRRR
jgi:hypothetical protein